MLAPHQSSVFWGVASVKHRRFFSAELCFGVSRAFRGDEAASASTRISGSLRMSLWCCWSARAALPTTPHTLHLHAELLSSAKATREACADSRDANFSGRVRTCAKEAAVGRKAVPVFIRSPTTGITRDRWGGSRSAGGNSVEARVGGGGTTDLKSTQRLVHDATTLSSESLRSCTGGVLRTGW